MSRELVPLSPLSTTMRFALVCIFAAFWCALAAPDLPVYSVLCTEYEHQTLVAAPRAGHLVTGRDSTATCKVYSDVVVPGASAWAKYSNDMNSTGWADLRVYTPLGAGESQLYSEQGRVASRVGAFSQGLPHSPRMLRGFLKATSPAR
jgi:hypothetical protein